MPVAMKGAQRQGTCSSAVLTLNQEQFENFQTEKELETKDS
jgi:hypothetical protein